MNQSHRIEVLIYSRLEMVLKGRLSVIQKKVRFEKNREEGLCDGSCDRLLMSMTVKTLSPVV
jgi:hypothetical protein